MWKFALLNSIFLRRIKIASVSSFADSRRLLHRRTYDLRVYARDDGRWDAEIELTDVKPRDITLESGVRAAGDPIHHMWLCITVDATLTITDARVRTLASPYPGYCEDYGDRYRCLVGLNLLRGFAHEVKTRLHGVQGCTHLTEALRLLPTAVVQGLAGEVLDPDGDGTRMPFQLDRCHALRLDGPAVLRYYPRWARPARRAEPDVAHVAAESAESA